MEWVGKPYKKEFYEGFRYTTNNRMELLAVIVGLEKLKNENTSVLVVSDSKYVVDSVLKKWVFGWEKKGFVGKKNPDLWKRFLIIYKKHQVDFKWIKGHNNHPQNERCDELAVMEQPRPRDSWRHAVHGNARRAADRHRPNDRTRDLEDRGRKHEVRVLDELSFEPGAFYVMDKGYLDFARLFRVHRSAAFFVLRAKSNQASSRETSVKTKSAS